MALQSLNFPPQLPSLESDRIAKAYQKIIILTKTSMANTIEVLRYPVHTLSRRDSHIDGVNPFRHIKERDSRFFTRSSLNPPLGRAYVALEYAMERTDILTLTRLQGDRSPKIATAT